MAKKRIPEVPRNGSEVDFIPQNFMLIDGAEGSAKMRMDLFGKASSVESLRTDLSNKLDKDGIGDDVRVQFTQSSSRTNIVTTSKLSTLFGKIQKWFADLGALAFKDKVGASDVDSGTYPIDISGTAMKLAVNAGDSTHPCFFTSGIPKQCLGVSTFRLFWGTMLVSWTSISGTVEPPGGDKQYIVTGSSTIDLHKIGGTHGDTGCMHFRVKGDGNGCRTLTVQYLDVFGNSRSFEIYWGNSSHLTRVNEFVVFWTDNLFPSYSTVYRHCTIVPVRLPDLGKWDGESV